LVEHLLLDFAVIYVFLLHLIDEVESLLDRVHDGLAVLLELLLVEGLDHFIEESILLFYSQFRPFVVLKR
jgi:hypothetical protein